MTSDGQKERRTSINRLWSPVGASGLTGQQVSQARRCPAGLPMHARAHSPRFQNGVSLTTHAQVVNFGFGALTVACFFSAFRARFSSQVLQYREKALQVSNFRTESVNLKKNIASWDTIPRPQAKWSIRLLSARGLSTVTSIDRVGNVKFKAIFLRSNLSPCQSC